jgi:hypothetical protein
VSSAPRRWLRRLVPSREDVVATAGLGFLFVGGERLLAGSGWVAVGAVLVLAAFLRIVVSVSKE